MEEYFACPYCGSENFVSIELGQKRFSSIQDCEICCRPIVVNVVLQGEYIDVRVERENE
jgi:transcription elongation factor Elf1